MALRMPASATQSRHRDGTVLFFGQEAVLRYAPCLKGKLRAAGWIKGP
jgi:hypothetical protein